MPLACFPSRVAKPADLFEISHDFPLSKPAWMMIANNHEPTATRSGQRRQMIRICHSYTDMLCQKAKTQNTRAKRFGTPVHPGAKWKLRACCKPVQVSAGPTGGRARVSDSALGRHAREQHPRA